MRAWAPLLGLFLAGCAATVVERTTMTPGPAELVVTNARVLTLDPIRPEAEAFAVSAGRFRVVGRASQVRPYIGSDTRVIDAGGAVVLPGLIDAHLHLLGEGFRLMRLDLGGTRSLEEVLGRVREAAAALPAGSWLVGRGWDQNDWPERRLPTALDLDAAVGPRPVLLTRVDGHSAWASSAALATAGIDASTPDPPGGRIDRDADGRPTGIVVDAALELVQARIPKPSRAERLEAARRAMAECGRHGITSVHEPGLGAEDIDVLKELGAAGELEVRIYAMLEPGDALERYVAAGPEVGLFGQRLTVRAVKIYADGSMGSRSAALLRDYADDPGNRGLMALEPAALERLVRRASQAGLQPCVHAIGDRANREVLDIYERLLAGGSPSSLRPRIEHAQHLDPADRERFARIGVIASMQPVHATSDMPWIGDRLGVERLAGAYAWRTLLRSGARLAFGSDAPVESVNPFHGIHAAVTRTDGGGEPAGGFQPQERIGIEEALRGFTLGAAYAAFEEELKGSIAPGKLADFVLLADDPRAVEPARLRDLTVRATYVGGTAVFEAK